MNKDSQAVFMHLLNILCKLAASYYIQKALRPMVSFGFLL